MNTISNNWRGKWKRPCLLLVITMLTVFAYGQVRISGKITSSSGVSTESIAVTVKGTKYGGIANNNG